MSRAIALASTVLVLVLVGCGGEDADPAPSGGTTETGCTRARAPAARPSPELPRPRTRLRRGQEYLATVTTSCGEFQITLDARRAPRTGGSFLSLVQKRFYDNTTFHRVVPGFVIQGGDPEGSGAGGPGYSVVERPPRSLEYVKGVVAMAKTGTDAPGTSGSQFFVVTGETAELPPEYALLGRVTAGMDVVERIGVVPVGAEDRPVEPVVIQRITMGGA